MQQTDKYQYLFSELQRGSNLALDTLYRKVGPSLLRYLRSIYCPNPEDVLQDSFLALFQQAPKLRPDTTVQAWLFKVARNRAFKSVSRYQMVSVEDTHLIADTPNPDHALMVQRAIGALEEPFRSTLALFHWEGFSLLEISEITETTLNTVKTRLFRARQMLKKSILSGQKHTRTATSGNSSSPPFKLTNTLRRIAQKLDCFLRVTFLILSKRIGYRKISINYINRGGYDVL